VLYDILLSCIIGATIGFIARKVLRFAEERSYVPPASRPTIKSEFVPPLYIDTLSLIDHESFLSFGVALTFFTLGVVGILGSDDILCCFVVGNSFTWDDWFRVQTEEHSFQDVIDQLLNSVSCP
jgi:NhaP-type Na+/H+ or K+/H+ antiporter